MPAAGGERAGPMPLRLCLDLNVLVRTALAQRYHRAPGASARVVRLVEDGYCALGPIQLVVSWPMLTTLRHILVARGHGSEQADAFIELLRIVAERGPLATPPYVILGGKGLLPMQDREDAGVAEAALAANTDLLLTFDMEDFAFGTRSRLRTEPLVLSADGRQAALQATFGPTRRLVVATPDLAIGWLLGQTVPPRGVLDRFVGRVPGA